MTEPSTTEPQAPATPSAGDPDPGTVVVQVPIVEVTVQEDRALVRREGTISVPAGRARLRIEGVAPVLVDKSLTVHVQGDATAEGGGDGDAAQAGGAAIELRSASARRWLVTEARQRPAALAELDAQLRGLEAERTRLGAQTRRVATEREAIAKLLQATLVELQQDAGWGRVEPARGHADLDALADRRAALGQQECTLRLELERVERDRADLQRLRAEARSVKAHAAAAIDLELHNPDAAARSVRLRVDYLVPGALWRPWHRARLVEGDDASASKRTPGAKGPHTLELQCEACVWQATGEDWDDVHLVLSTERPSLGLRPPPLHTDRLALRKKGPEVEVQAREQEIHTAGLGASEPGPQAKSDGLPGIDDGGQAQRLRSRERSAVPSDGRPHRVPLFSLRSEADVGLRCIPELAPAVLLRSEQTNTADHPLLAGPVDLVRGSGLVGRTSILYVAPGERFELGWGPEHALRVTREIEMLETSRRTLSSWTRKPRRVRIKLSNLDATPCVVQVQERIAVSEIDKVEVELQVATDGVKPDADGILRWDVHLQGLGRREITLEWTLVVHDDVQGL